MVLSALAAALQLLAGGAPPEEPLIAFTSRGIWVVPADGGERVKLSEPYRRTRRTELRPLWSPDGRRLGFKAYLERDALSGGAAYHVHVMEPDGDGVVNVTGRHFREAGDFDWAPDGRTIVVDVWSERVDRHRLFAVPVGGGPARRLTGGDDFAPRVSPDGRKIAFSRFRGERADLYVVGAGGGGARRLARNGSAPAWSPDGGRIAYIAPPGSLRMLDLRDGTRVTLATLRGGIGEPAWSPDGSRIAFSVHRRGSRWDVWVVDAATGRVDRLTNERGDEYGPVWSPGGDRLAFELSRFGGGRDNTGSFDVFVMSADGSGRRNLTRCRCTMGGGISWRPAG